MRTTVRIPAVLWIHGGGLVIGHPAQDDDLCRDLAAEAGCLVAAVSYRLAPEHPYPAALDDCHAALAWLAERDDVVSDRIAVGGASAGGGLAAALALRARDEGPVAPVLQLLVYPMLDDRTAARTDLDESQVRLWNTTSNDFGWRAYLGQAPGSEGVDPLAAPARADDLAGVAPAWIGVGTHDLFWDENLDYAERLEAAGVPCELETVEGAFHGFDAVARKTDVSRAFRSAQAEAVRTALVGRR